MTTVLTDNIIADLQGRFGAATITPQATADGIPTAWVPAGEVRAVLGYLKGEVAQPYRMLYDLAGIDEREHRQREGQPASDFSVVYQLLSLDRKAFLRLKVPLQGEHPSLPTITDLWPNANWYERELWDMFGVGVDGHPCLRRLLLPPWWEGHALRKEHPSRATELGVFAMSETQQAAMEEQMHFRPADWGLTRHGEDFDYMFLNVGPHHPSTHGVIRFILQLDGQEIVDSVVDIGFHHRGQEKIAERQTWHTYLPYTDRVDYLGGFTNELPYVLAAEALAGIVVPERVQVIRVMLCELYRIISHFVYLGTYSQDLGMMSPVFYTFNDRERALDIVEAVSGGRMHPGWFRVGGVAQDLPEGWDGLVRDFLTYLPSRLREFEKSVLGNRIFKARTKGISSFTVEEGIDWGISGPLLRACGLAWDLRKARPYSGYERFAFDIPTGSTGDCYDRMVVHLQEMWQSLRIIEQCLQHMPAGPYKAKHPLTSPPLKEQTMHDIETLITHFLNVSWGPAMPAGEACVPTEGTKGHYSYYLISDGNTTSYRTRIRTASFPHVQMVPYLLRGLTIADFVAILASLDFVVADVDR